jgi:alkyl hydroperoxide reductase subunit AhpC
VFFSHPKDFTPVCTTELGEVARLEPEFDRRGAKVIGLSVDPVADHERWAAEIEETQGAALSYPLVGDPDRKVAELYGMLNPASDPLDSLQLTARHRVATPVNREPGGDVIIAPSVSDEQARSAHPEGWQALKPYLRVVRQPES